MAIVSDRLARVRLTSFLHFAVAIGSVYGLTQCSENPEGSEVDPGGTAARGGATSGGGASGLGRGGSLNIPLLPSETGGTAAKGPCVGLECQQTSCTLGACAVPACTTAGAVTSVSGTVFDPAGKVPLYNVVVYVPNGPVPAFTDGASCDRCDASIANPVAATLTDTSGAFVLNDVPVGADIPLVIQVGKWRRQIVVPAVAGCVDTPLADKNLTRLPRNTSEGDIPRIAITTGGADSMECLPRRMGLDDSVFSTEAGTGRIHLYSGADNGNDTKATKAFAANLNGGAALTRATQLWDDVASLSAYDIVILSCEGGTIAEEKPMSARQAMYAYASAGGRVFASHWHHIWFSDGPAPVPTVGTWLDRPDPQDPAIANINTAFPKGKDFATWLVNVQASMVEGQLSINVARDNLQTVNTTHATEWITLPNNSKCTDRCNDLNGNQKTACQANCTESPGAVEYLSFNAPLAVPEAEQCGRAVFTDLHVSATGPEKDKDGAPFPEKCEMRDLSAQEKAVEFMLFDLSSCIQDDDDPPRPPVVR